MASYKGEIRRDGNTGKRKSDYFLPPASTNGEKYVLSVMDPFSQHGARVPDLASYPTTTSCVQLEYTQTAVANSDALGYSCGGALMLNSGYINYCPEIYTGTSDGTRDSRFSYAAPGGGGASKANTYNFVSPYGAVGSSNNLASGVNNLSIPGCDAMQANYSATRLVAAGIQIEYIGNDQNNQGLITCCQVTSLDVQQSYTSYTDQGATGWLPFKNWSNAAGVITTAGANAITPVISQSLMENFRGNYSGPAKDGTKVNFQPLDDDDLLLGNMVNIATNVTPNANSYASSYNYYLNNHIRTTTEASFAQQNLGMLQWHAQGISSTAQFRVKIMCHFEGIPNTDNLSYDKPVPAPLDTNAQCIVNIMGQINQGMQFSAKYAPVVAEFAGHAYQCFNHWDVTSCAQASQLIVDHGEEIYNALSAGKGALTTWKACVEQYLRSGLKRTKKTHEKKLSYASDFPM